MKKYKLLGNILVMLVCMVTTASATLTTATNWPTSNECWRYGPGGSVTINGTVYQCNGATQPPIVIEGCRVACHACCGDGYPGGGSSYNTCISCCDAYNYGNPGGAEHCLQTATTTPTGPG